MWLDLIPAAYCRVLALALVMMNVWVPAGRLLDVRPLSCPVVALLAVHATLAQGQTVSPVR